MSTTNSNDAGVLPAIARVKRVSPLKRRLSAPVESLAMNPFSLSSRKKLRMSEPDDLSAAVDVRTPSEHSARRGRRHSRVEEEKDPSSTSSSDDEASQRVVLPSRRSSRATLAIRIAGSNPAPAPPSTRRKPNLSVRIPPPPSSLQGTASGSGAFTKGALSSSRDPMHTPQSATFLHLRPSSRSPLPQGQLTPRTPATPIDQVLRRPAAPPAIPRYPERELNDARMRRDERLFAPTPTEWTFSSSLNHAPKAPVRSFSQSTIPSDALKNGASDVITPMEVDPALVRNSEATIVVPSYLTAAFAAQRIGGGAGGPISSTAQPLASPYATHFPSPTASVSSLPSTLSRTSSSSSFGTPVSSQYSSSNNSPVTAVTNLSASLPPSTKSPFLAVPQAGPCRPPAAHRRSSLGPGRGLELISSQSAVPLASNSPAFDLQPSRSSTMGYFDIRPTPRQFPSAYAAGDMGLGTPRSRAASMTSAWANPMTSDELGLSFGEELGGDSGEDVSSGGTVTPAVDF